MPNQNDVHGLISSELRHPWPTMMTMDRSEKRASTLGTTWSNPFKEESMHVGTMMTSMV